MTSSSRTEPPGSTIARTPASASTCGPSAKGKKASLAATEPRARSPALATASLAESTRLTCPIPIPTEACPEASRIALDLTQRHARQANSRSRRMLSSAAGPAASRQAAAPAPGSPSPGALRRARPRPPPGPPPAAGRPQPVGGLHQQPPAALPPVDPRSRIGPRAAQQPLVLLPGQDLQGSGLEAGRDDHLEIGRASCREK